MKYLLLLIILCSCSSEPTEQYCTLISRKEIAESLVLIYTCGDAGDYICRTVNDKSVDCLEELNKLKQVK